MSCKAYILWCIAKSVIVLSRTCNYFDTLLTPPSMTANVKCMLTVASLLHDLVDVLLPTFVLHFLPSKVLVFSLCLY